MEKTLFGFIWKYTKPQQVLVLLITIISFPLLYYTLELPKIIVNDAIDGQNFPRSILGLNFEQNCLFTCSLFCFFDTRNNKQWHQILFKRISRSPLVNVCSGD